MSLEATRCLKLLVVYEAMNSTWKIRLILAVAIGVIVFGDFLGYGTSSHDSFTSKDTTAQQVKKRAVFKLNSDTGKIYLEGESM